MKNLNTYVLAAGIAASGGIQAQSPDRPLNLELDTRHRAQSALSVGISGDMAMAGVLMGEGPILLKIAWGVSSRQKEALLALGFQFTENGYIIFKWMTSRSDIEAGQTVEARGGWVEIGVHKPTDAIDSLALSYQSGKGTTKHLGTDIQTFTVTNIDQFIRWMQEIQRTTTRTITQRTDTSFVWHTVQQASLRAGLNISDNATGDVVVNYSKVGKNPSNTDVLLWATLYSPSTNTNVSFRAWENIRAINANWGVTPATSLSAGVMKARGQDVQYVISLTYALGGGKMSPVWKKSSSTRQSLETHMQNMTVSSDGLGDARRYWSVKQEVTTSEEVSTQERVVGQVKTPEPTPEKPIVPGAPVCTADDTANIINCSDDPTSLEMSLDNGATWIAFVATGHTGNKTVLVRKKANGATPASPATTVSFTEATPWTPPELPATLPQISVHDNGGLSPLSFTVNMPNLLDSNGNPIQYNVDGLPSSDINWPITSKNIVQVGSNINVSFVYTGFFDPARDSYTLTVTSPNGVGTTTVPLRIIPE